MVKVSRFATSTLGQFTEKNNKKNKIMTYKQMIEVVEQGLNIPHRRARVYIEDHFAKKYKGHKEAITNMEARYSDAGEVLLIYTINNKQNTMVL